MVLTTTISQFARLDIAIRIVTRDYTSKPTSGSMGITLYEEYYRMQMDITLANVLSMSLVILANVLSMRTHLAIVSMQSNLLEAF
jgi:hypothetical protein